MSSSYKLPRLRFPEFTDKWQATKLDDLLKIGSGRDFRHLSKGNIPVYGTGGLMLYVNDYLYDGKSICIGRKGTINKPQFLNGKFWTVDTLFYTHDYKNSVPEFLYLIFQKINWLQHNEASGVPSLSKTTIEKIKVTIPSMQEQKKIAEFMAAVDDKCNVLQQKINLLKKYKKGVMQRIFSQKIRFKDENGNNYPTWQTKKLGDIAKIKTGGLNVEDAQDDGKYMFFDRSETIKKYNEYSYDNEALIYAGEGSEFLPRYYKGKYGLHQRAYTVFNANGVIIKFLYYFMLTQNSYFIRMAVGSTVKSLRMDCFTKCVIPILVDEEQQKIANFLTVLDDKIKLEESKLEQAKNLKKALLQQMFV